MQTAATQGTAPIGGARTGAANEAYDDCRSLAAVAQMYQLSGHDRAGRTITNVLRVCQNDGSCPRTEVCRRTLQLQPQPTTEDGKEAAPAGPASGTRIKLDQFVTDSVLSDQSGNAVQRVRVQPADDETPLGTLFRYWRRVPRRPRLADIDPMMIRRMPGLDGYVHLVRAGGLDVADWQFRVFGYHLHLPGSPPMEGRRIFDGPPLIYAGAAARDYMTSKCMQLPLAYRVRRAIGGVSRSFDRQVLPLFGGDGRVEYLLVAIGNFGEEGPA